MFLKRSPRGEIIEPGSNGSVTRLFQVKGTIEQLPMGQHLFLVVQIGGLMWPKVEVHMDGSSWVAEVREGGAPPNGEFALSLYSVGPKGYDEITGWFNRGNSTGHYPGLWRIADSARLDSINLKLRQPSRP
jgi:hypothetical protein